MRGNCYVASEALWHILGGPSSEWQVMRLSRVYAGDTHWFLKHRSSGAILDPSVRQFHNLPQYMLAKRAAFLTKRPSKRAQVLMETLTWQK